jgi:hypothetical protein
MIRTSLDALRSLALIALVAVTLAPAVGGNGSGTASIANQASADRAPVPAPTILTQGRCVWVGYWRCF